MNSPPKIPSKEKLKSTNKSIVTLFDTQNRCPWISENLSFVCPGLDFSPPQFAGATLPGQVARHPREPAAAADRLPPGEDRPAGPTVPPAEATADATAGSCHLGDGGETAARAAPAGQATAQRHVLPAKTSDAGKHLLAHLF